MENQNDPNLSDWDRNRSNFARDIAVAVPHINRKMTTSQKLMVYAGLPIIGLMCASIVSERPKETPDYRIADHSHEAYYVAKNYITKRLKSPSTAEFPSYVWNDGDINIRKTGATYTVSAWVDASNSFGAKLRKRWICVVTENSNSWETGSVCRLLE